MLKKISWPATLPWLLFIIGFFCITVGTFGDFENSPKFGKYFVTLGSSILASGIFALILKSIQFLGVFKEELNSVIFETKFLKNRVDLPIYWEKVTKELVKDKFPQIHSSIMKDVKETYLPTSVVAYYDKGFNYVDIELIDIDSEFVKVKHKQSFNIVPAEQSKSIAHPFSNRLVMAEGCKTTKCDVDSIKVNGVSTNVKINQYIEGNSLMTKFVVPLGGDKAGYKIEIETTRSYCLKYDNIIGFSNSHIMNGLKVQIHLNGVKAKFFESGTLSSFKTITSKDTFIEKDYPGIIYKGQGYLICLEKK